MRRCERHDGIFKKNLHMVVTASGITDKTVMKMAAANCVSVKNALIRQGLLRLATGTSALRTVSFFCLKTCLLGVSFRPENVFLFFLFFFSFFFFFL